MAATNSAFRTETRDEHLYNHIELFNRSSSPIDAPAANRCQDCRERQPTHNQIATGRRMFSDYITESNNEHLYNNIQSINKPSSPATESQAANQTSQDDRRGQQPTGNSKTMLRRVSSAMNNTYVDKAIKKVETLRKLSIEKDWPCLICMSETSSGNMGRFPFSQNFRNFRFGGKWNTFRRFFPLENSQRKWKI